MTATSASTFEQLMSEVADGSQDAIWQLAETYTPYIVRAARSCLPKRVRSRLDSQDVAQMLWKSLLLGRQDLMRLKTPQDLIAYLARAARNKAIDATRQHTIVKKNDVNREVNLADVDMEAENLPRRRKDKIYARDPSPSEFAIIRERWQQMIAKATKRDRQILEMRFERMSFDAIAQKLKINPATARRAISRLIDQLSE